VPAEQGKDPSLLALKDSEAVALIAYLQRLGTDIKKPAVAPTAGEPAAAEASATGGE